MSEILNSALTFETMLKVQPTKGQLVYEYNPLRNYRCTRTMFEYQGDYYTEDQLKEEFNIVRSSDNKEWHKDVHIEEVTDSETGEITQVEKYTDVTSDITLYEPGELLDFITDSSQLGFSATNPVSILPQYSYDGSVNLILNDGVNTPRLINTRFSATGKNTYEVVDRKGDNDTNIYDQGEQFDIDTSLFKQVQNIPKLTYQGTASGGNLKIGNYHFYFKLSDADGNETDYVAESGLVSIFIGFTNPCSITTGTKNENSYKSVKFTMSNIDLSYNYIYVYYSRYTAEGTENFNTEYQKIDKKFLVSNSGTATISITGFEETVPVTVTDINDCYELVDAAKTQVACGNMLFLGNVHKQDIPYEKLTRLSLEFLPYLSEKDYLCDLSENYILKSTGQGYYDSKFIYNYTGYWNEELYRLGIVYILPNGQLTPVFNIRGNTTVTAESTYSAYSLDENINYDEDTYLISPNPKVTYNSDGSVENYVAVNAQNENVKGVIRLKSNNDTNKIFGIQIKADSEVITALKEYVRGFFFVRQSRIPTILAQGVTMAIDQEAHTPCIATADGVLSDIGDSLSNTHVETDDINDVNYVSEGFLHRYSFHFKKKHSGLFSKILKGVAIGVAVVGIAAACVFTAGAAGAIATGAALSGAITTGVTTLSTTLAAVGVAAAGASAATVIGTTALVAVGAGIAVGATINALGVIQEVRYGTNRLFTKKTLNGRSTKCPSGYKLVEDDESRKLTQNFQDRLIIKDSSKVKVQAILCPDYEVNQAYFNQIFTGNNHLIGLTNTQSTNGLVGHSSNYFTNNGRHFYLNNYYDMNIRNSYNLPLIAVPDNTKCVGLNDFKFRSRAGYAEEAWRYECIGDDYKSEYSKNNSDEDDETISNKKINTDIIRGSFGAYLGIASDANNFSPAETVNIYIPDYSVANMLEYVKIRMDDNTPYQAITDRFAISDLTKSTSYLTSEQNKVPDFDTVAYRGDCYICQFTHRLNRNFQDPSAPYNDDIVDEDSWRDNYNPEKSEDYENINLGDVNAIQLGMWVTFRIRSPYNLNIRTLDSSNVDEKQMTGHARGYYPYHPMSVDGSYKIPESEVYNKGFSKSLSDQYRSLLPDVPYIKNWFGTRIMYSDIHINDAYKNGYRVFRKTRRVDYTREYGEITKLVPMGANLLIVFEHGVALAPVDQTSLSTTASQVIATKKVLPDVPTIISDTFGSQWVDSILKTPSGVYGVDTVAKKIWFTDGSKLNCISDCRVQEYLNNNISLSERELTPILGVRNVKTCYNANKQDVMFTFYDNTTGFQECVWNLCYNEIMGKFITFYSWVPSFMENIYNVPFSFNRDTSKWISKLGTSHSTSSFAAGITLTNVVFDSSQEGNGNINFTFPITYITKQGVEKTIKATVQTTNDFIGVLQLSNRVVPDSSMFYNVKYELRRDIWGNYKNFQIRKIAYSGDNYYTLGSAGSTDAKFAGSKVYIYGLFMNTNSPVYTRDTSSDIETSKVAVSREGEDGREIVYMHKNIQGSLLSELYYRNSAGHAYADDEVNKLTPTDASKSTLPIFKNKEGKREMLPRDQQINADTIVKLLNIKATISVTTGDASNLSDYYYNSGDGYEFATYESTVAVIPQRNMQFLTTDFWKHGQAGIFDIADDIYPCYWYGKQHPFEFEVIVVNDPSVHKIFTNLELIANKAKPESFHYEVVGESYDFAKDKPNMYFRQEAMKALWQYNGCDIEYNSNFLNVQTRQQAKSADLPHNYFARRNGLNEIEDYYVAAEVGTHDYRHLSGGEIVYYPTRQEYRVWNHALAVDVDDQPDTSASAYGGRGLMASNMRYLEDRWKIQINPLLITYKNEYKRKNPNKALCIPENSTWKDGVESGVKLPPLPLYNSPIPDEIKERGEISIPGYSLSVGSSTGYVASTDGSDNAMYNLYKVDFENNIHPFDTESWLDDVNIYKCDFGSAQNRKETDMRDKFIKIKIRYSGEELAVIDFLCTIYQVSYA